eukprot:c4302_g1_i1 orf=3-158(-)
MNSCENAISLISYDLNYQFDHLDSDDPEKFIKETNKTVLIDQAASAKMSWTQ